MQEFSSADNGHTFVIDGETHTLAALGPDEFEAVGEVLGGDPASVFPRTRDFLYSHTDEGGKAAIAKLSIKQMGELFRAWVGLGSGGEPGESSGSAAKP
jgi:hypothetical protein